MQGISSAEWSAYLRVVDAARLRAPCSRRPDQARRLILPDQTAA